MFLIKLAAVQPRVLLASRFRFMNNNYLQPAYKNELSVFKKETLEKIEEFRAARNNWIATSSNQVVNTSMKEGLYQSNEYRGRCALLRRIRFKTTFLRVHHKTLRPMKFYTFKEKLSDAEIEKVINEKLEKSKIFTKCPKLDENLAPVGYLQDEKSGKKKKSKKICPSKKATKKLKASKLERKLVGACRCESGKGLTVVIKGVCLCDKKTLNKLTLGKICKGYTRLESEKTKPAEPVSDPVPLSASNLSRVKDSIELHKKKNNKCHLKKVREEKEDSNSLLEWLSKKGVKFTHYDRCASNNRDAEVGRKVTIKNKEEPTHKSATTSTERKKIPLIKWNSFKEFCKKKFIKKKNDQNSNKINKPKLCAKKRLIFEEKDVTKDFLKTKPTEKKTETGNANESTITLYKNKPQERSCMNLTKEQYQKMKIIRKQNYKKVKKEKL